MSYFENLKTREALPSQEQREKANELRELYGIMVKARVAYNTAKAHAERTGLVIEEKEVLLTMENGDKREASYIIVTKPVDI